eukprot:6456941-Amphidinium_carterae.2
MSLHGCVMITVIMLRNPSNLKAVRSHHVDFVTLPNAAGSPRAILSMVPCMDSAHDAVEVATDTYHLALSLCAHSRHDLRTSCDLIGRVVQLIQEDAKDVPCKGFRYLR